MAQAEKVEIIKEMLKLLPDGIISDAAFEGANIVLYTKDKTFFRDNTDDIRGLVNTFKKRVEMRADPSIALDIEEAEKMIRSIVPAEAAVGTVRFDSQRSTVLIETEKPGVAIGKQGELLRQIRSDTFWTPVVRRMPAIKSNLIENIRQVYFQHSDYRRKFLDKVGHRIYDGWMRGKKQEWVRITFLGAGRQVGRSCFLLQTPESRIMLDCGVNVASDEPTEAFPILDCPEFNIQDLDAVVLSHAHLDHCGFIPYLFKYGYRGPVYCTEPTRDIAALLLIDYVKIMKGDNRTMIFDIDDIKEFVKHVITLDFEEVTDITPDVRLTLYNAGHILGSAMCHFNIGNGLHNYVYTADLKFGRTPLLDPAACHFPRLETLMIESTYGGKTNVLPPGKEQDEFLVQTIKETIARGGKVLMPVLGSGRAQDVMVIIENLVRTGQMEKVPVYVDGMVWDITAIHTAYPEFLNGNIRKLIFHKDENPFLADFFKHVGSAKERKEVLEETGACVILATSGMMVGGPVIEYFKNLADNPKNTLIFSSYQAEGSLGYRIMHGEKEIIFRSGTRPEMIKVNMEVFRLEITDHSDRKQLMNFLYKVSPRPKKVLVNHGEVSRCLDLASSIHKQNKVETLAPRNLETVRLK
jgi:KH/beta-lactamase-domain protein